jgi:hypothetical protein
MTHIASLVVHRCAQQAESRGLDPRGHLSEINWSQMLDGLLGPEDLQMMWYFIRREYPQHTLTAILDATQPYSDLTLDKLIQEEIRLKYKDTIPKPPLTPYMMFMKTKQPKLKRKYPDLPMTEVATKIGKKWSTMAEEKKEKYKQQYVALKAAYDTQLKTFYEEHPDAKPPPKQPASRSKKLAKNTAHAVGDTEEEKRIRALKAELPKLPLSAYLHFCKKKREKLHRKYPDLPPNAVTVKLGKRWQTMDEEARGTSRGAGTARQSKKDEKEAKSTGQTTESCSERTCHLPTSHRHITTPHPLHITTYTSRGAGIRRGGRRNSSRGAAEYSQPAEWWDG